ncbi:hypothetical protein GCM10027020_15370 [Nocardioides salsibiostraticola]
MTQWLEDLSTLQVLLFVVMVLIVGSVLATIVGAVLVRLGMKQPWVLRRASRLVAWLLELVKRPLTIVVLDEVAAVIQTGHYTQNISSAILENHDELKALIAEKIREDPNAKLVSRIPGYETIVSEVTETSMRVLIAALGDPRMDELVSDLLRNNLQQIKRAVREKEHERLGEPSPPDPIPESAPKMGSKRP